MRVALTGHTSGIGKALYDMLLPAMNPTGFSLDNGYNIEYYDHREKILQRIEEEKCDVVVNNAFCRDGQLLLLYALWERWKDDPSKTIINIGTFATEIPVFNDKMVIYTAYKAALKQLCFQLQRKKHRCRLIHVRFGFVDTPFSKEILETNPNSPRMTDKQAAMSILQLIENMALEVQEITILARQK